MLMNECAVDESRERGSIRVHGTGVCVCVCACVVQSVLTHYDVCVYVICIPPPAVNRFTVVSV